MEKNYTDQPYGVIYSADKKILRSGHFEVTDYCVLPGTEKLAPECWEKHDKLRRIALPKGVWDIGERAFYACSHLEYVELPSTITHMGCGAFAGSALKQIFIPYGVEVISQQTFEGCSDLESCMLPDTIERLEDHAFSACPKARILIYSEVPRLKYIAPEAVDAQAAFMVRRPLQKAYMEAFPHCAEQFYAFETNEMTMRGTVYSPDGKKVREYVLNPIG